ncbi:hypothetical protein EVAR_61801_1 [Eumeta japonica]|uniref:Uncharacterized protein n=1 Tax=Eumeta variegata TaxID=151549 RepID=A0A4C1Z379_EUMVA|nr:hypothetical protein EVAR_61801_1 [Eumeta japonica]
MQPKPKPNSNDFALGLDVLGELSCERRSVIFPRPRSYSRHYLFVSAHRKFCDCNHGHSRVASITYQCKFVTDSDCVKSKTGPPCGAYAVGHLAPSRCGAVSTRQLF